MPRLAQHVRQCQRGKEGLKRPHRSGQKGSFQPLLSINATIDGPYLSCPSITLHEQLVQSVPA